MILPTFGCLGRSYGLRLTLTPNDLPYLRTYTKNITRNPKKVGSLGFKVQGLGFFGCLGFKTLRLPGFKN